MLRRTRRDQAPPPVVVPHVGIPEWDPGATTPFVLADERACAVAFYASRSWLRDHAPDWPGAVIGVTFQSVSAHQFGAPNDETLHGHPLWAHGLRPYMCATVENSPWIAALRAVSRVHPMHVESATDGRVHYVLCFHDTTLECVARGYTVTVSNSDETTPSALVRTLL